MQTQTLETSPLPIQTPKTSPLCTQNHSTKSFEHCFFSFNLSSSPIGDYIGSESCLDLQKNVDVSVIQSYVPRRENRVKSATKEYPPPIPLLARTGNLSSHMPWILRRYYTDGRLILKAERVKHHEYFRAERSDGRLILQMIPLDHEVDNYFSHCLAKNDDETTEEEEEEGDDEDEDGEEVKEEEEEKEEEDIEEVINENEEAKEQRGKDYVVYDERNNNSNNNNNAGGIGGNLSPCKLLNYNKMMQNCIFQMPVPTLRPVHT
ncbi:protein FANTASTIC FOUR 1-like [Euphorbia lathyris]|uniref:protein FANTASTIC FOUR 1-like n=1 Tax=Euphorbia lathyris TaxID=212925 RepID=UPI0033143C20